MNVVFVCSGNICRSAMAEAYMADRIVAAGLRGRVRVGSAGTLRIEGVPASAEAILSMQEIGVDLRRHRSRGLSEEILHGADLVIAMTHAHLWELATSFPGQSGRRFLIRAFEAGPEPEANAEDLEDPVGGPLGVFREQRETITRAVDHLLAWIARQA